MKRIEFYKSIDGFVCTWEDEDGDVSIEKEIEQTRKECKVLADVTCNHEAGKEATITFVSQHKRPERKEHGVHSLLSHCACMGNGQGD
jgi:hypothetical protein